MFRALASVLLCCFFLEASFWVHFSYGDLTTCSGIVPMTERGDKISITDFGGVSDGQTLNTIAFRKAIYRIQHLRRRGGTLLFVPSGVYLTDSFNLTSHMTLYLARGAVIKATQLKELDVYHQSGNSKIPTIEDALKLISASVRQVILDAKVGPPSYEKGLANDILSTVEKMQCKNCLIWAKSDSLVRDIIKLSSDVAVRR